MRVSRSNTYGCEPCGLCPWCRREGARKHQVRALRAEVRKLRALLGDVRRDVKDVSEVHLGDAMPDPVDEGAKKRLRRIDKALARAVP